jgi:polar amino acid transport system substrate-binding protein
MSEHQGVTFRRVRAGVLVVVAALIAAACASSTPGSSGGTTTSSSAPTASGSTITVTKDPTIAAEVPASIAAQGSVVVAADASYAPNEFVGTDNQVTGWDVQLGEALGKVMGVEWKFTNVGFDGIIPGLQSGKYGVGMSSFTITAERMQVVDFVSYYTAGTSFYVKAGSNTGITSLDTLCGHTVGVERGTTQSDDATAQSKTCTSAGKQAVTVQVFPDQNGANLALASGRVEAVMADSPVAAYAVQQSKGQFELSGQPYGEAPYGIALPKGNGMAQPTLDALKKLMADGVYTQILTQWGVQLGAIDNPEINPAV